MKCDSASMHLVHRQVHCTACLTLRGIQVSVLAVKVVVVDVRKVPADLLPWVK